MKTNLLVDLSNITFVAYFANKKEFTRELLFHKVLESIFIVANEYKVDGIMVACDSPNVWRRETYTDYKGKRDLNRDENYEDVKSVIIELKEFFNECTSIPAVSVDHAEADDIIAVFVQSMEDKEDRATVIYSNDGDFFQLATNERVFFHSPIKAKGFTEYNPDRRDFDLFVKCIRGDTGDNVPSAFPRVRVTKLEAAWNDKTEMVNLMETVPKGASDRVKDAYERNRILIDLTCQPQKVRDAVSAEITRAAAGEYGAYNQIKFRKFLAHNSLKNIASNITRYSKIFQKRVIL
jgi:hypothetical protein